MASPPNPAEVPIMTYEYPFCLPSSEQPRSPVQRKARGLMSWSYTPSTVGRRLSSNKYEHGPVPSSGKWLGNQVAHTGYGSITPS
jgi:hypothetical protein